MTRRGGFFLKIALVLIATLVSCTAVHAARIAAGVQHSCQVRNGGVECWGSNRRSELGLLGTDLSPIPRWTIAPGSGATDVAAGRFHTCALVDSKLRCWGTGTDGQLGYGATTVQSTPGAFQLEGATRVAAALFHTCAVASGALWCWGSDSVGQLGNADAGAQTTPMRILSHGVTQVDVGAYHTCAIQSGALYCWGSGDDGRLGSGSENDLQEPGDPVFAEGVTAVSTGWAHTCALVEGTLWCWGQNVRGQLGGGPAGPNAKQLSPIEVPLPGGEHAIGVAAGSYHTCAWSVAGNVYCWGYNIWGQVGDGSVLDSASPVAIVMPKGYGTAGMEVDANGTHTCALASNVSLCWGLNSEGQLGHGGSGFPVAVPSEPVGAITEVSAGSEHTCGVSLPSDGNSGGIVCWGLNGALGVAATAPLPTPQLALSGSALRVDAGSLHSCGVSNGGIYCWGRNFKGQLGTGNLSGSALPVQVVNDGSGATHVTAGGEHTCGIVSGAVYCWGSQQDGRLGNGMVNQQALVPEAIPSLSTDATDVSAGARHTCAVQASRAWCWGRGEFGQLGLGSTESKATPSQLDLEVRSLSAGENHTCAVSLDNAIYCWGSNAAGQLGIGESTPQTSPALVADGGADGTVLVAAGVSHTCGLMHDKVHCWGKNDYGQLGDGSFQSRSTPVPVEGAVNAAGVEIIALSVGLQHSCASSATATWCWGRAQHGRLGNGQLGWNVRPVATSPVVFGDSFE